MKKILFVSSYDENKQFSGINKKIYSQYLALVKNKNSKVYLSTLKNTNDIKEIGIYQKNHLSIYRNKIDFFLKRWNFINDFINKENICTLYIRYEHFSSPNFLRFLKKNKDKKIIIEIPTYPYDDEYKRANKITKLKHKIDKLYRQELYKYVDKIVTFSIDEVIWGIPCINISNGINLKEIKMVEKREKNILHFTSVSSCDFWHGIDRMLLALEKYGKLTNKKKIRFNIVGEGTESFRLKKIVSESEYLSKIVIFQGFKSGKELDDIYDETDIGVGSLGRHRSGLETMRALKNREYCAKGLPMVFSEDDPDLRDAPFVYHVSADEELIDIESIIEWYKKINLTPEDIREYSKQFSWDIQMKKVIDEIEKL